MNDGWGAQPSVDMKVTGAVEWTTDNGWDPLRSQRDTGGTIQAHLRQGGRTFDKVVSSTGARGNSAEPCRAQDIQG
eukprot:SAG31_NODE_51_length_30464_cov_16.835628_21_plen_76_part_00